MAEMRGAQHLKQIITEGFEREIRVTEVSPHSWILRLPYNDAYGDPISLMIEQRGDEIEIDDGGAIAGVLFSLGQHTEDTPAFKLLTSLCRAYELDIDFDAGLIRGRTPPADFFQGFADFTKVVISMLTTIPHLRVRPRRLPGLGPRLKRRIRDNYLERHVLNLVERNVEMPGSTVEGWPADFHWRLGTNGSHHEVFVIAMDLDIQNPLSKVERLSAMALDTQNMRNDDKLRVVMDTHGGDIYAQTAANFILRYHETLAYEVYDFGDPEQRLSFIDLTVNELHSESAEEWRAILSDAGRRR